MTGNQGMSSEELDKLTTEDETPSVEDAETPPAEELDEETPAGETPPEEPEEDLAQAALDETEENKVDPKDAVIGDYRRRLRDAEREAARLQGQLEAQQEKPQEKSPLELAAEEQNRSVDEVLIDGKLYREQQVWEEKQATAKAQRTAAEDYKSGSEAAFITMTDETLGEGLGLESLARLGEQLLTEQDKREVFSAGRRCGIVLYGKLKERIIEAGGVNAQELQKRLKPTQAKPKEEPKTPKTPTKKPGSKPQDEGDESEVRASTSAIMGELEMF